MSKFQIRILLLVALACYATWDARAFPIRPIIAQHISACNDLYHCRTIWNLTWNSLATIFSCTWVAVHPNIPDPKHKIKFWRCRLVLMVITLIVPELVVIWAMRQWFSVLRQSAKEPRHSEVPQPSKAMLFFALMGGFMDKREERLHLDDEQRFYKRDEQGVILILDEEGRFYKLDKQGKKDVLDEEGKLGEHGRKPALDLHLFELGLVDADIEDKSKSGVLSKGFAVVQTSWFLLQCLVRVAQRLPVTELEITTFAFAALNFTIYLLWWNKPLAVERPIYVHKRRPNGTATGHSQSITTRLFIEIVKFLDRPLMKHILGRVESAQKAVIRDQLHCLRWLLLRWWVRPFAVPVFEMIGLEFPWREKKPPVPYNFYAGEASELPFIAPAAGWVALLFGAIHCSAWRFQFPSQIEQTLWRVSAAVITCTPMFYLVLGSIILIIYLSADESLCSEHWGLLRKILMFAFILAIALTGVLYFFARIILVTLAIMALRSLPPGAYQTVYWINYIPHF